MTFDIHGVMQGLAGSRPIFHSEADFRFALAWRIKEMLPGHKVRLEFKPFANEGLYLDIWLPTIGAAIELKYIKSPLIVEHDDELFSLREGATDFGSYDFLKDVQRLERVVADREGAKCGYAILLTNALSCWKQPSVNRNATIFEAFRIHEGRLIKPGEVLAWKVGSKPGKERETPIILSSPYHMCWQDYSEFTNERRGEFRYLIVSVGD